MHTLNANLEVYSGGALRPAHYQPINHKIAGLLDKCKFAIKKVEILLVDFNV